MVYQENVNLSTVNEFSVPGVSSVTFISECNKERSSKAQKTDLNSQFLYCFF